MYMKESVKLKNKDLNVLIFEIKGFKSPNNEVVCKGILNEKITLGTKFKINNILKEIESQHKNFVDFCQDMIKKVYPNGITQEEELKKIETNDKEYKELVESIKQLSEEEVEIYIEKIDLNLLDNVESEYNYSFLIEKIVKY